MRLGETTESGPGPQVLAPAPAQGTRSNAELSFSAKLWTKKRISPMWGKAGSSGKPVLSEQFQEPIHPHIPLSCSSVHHFCN